VRSRSYGRKKEGEELTGKTSSAKSLRHWRSTVKEIWGSWMTAKYETAFSSRWQSLWRSGVVGNFLQRRQEAARD
jgi:hypothetical protein